MFHVLETFFLKSPQKNCVIGQTDLDVVNDGLTECLLSETFKGESFDFPAPEVDGVLPEFFALDPDHVKRHLVGKDHALEPEGLITHPTFFCLLCGKKC